MVYRIRAKMVKRKKDKRRRDEEERKNGIRGREIVRNENTD